MSIRSAWVVGALVFQFFVLYSFLNTLPAIHPSPVILKVAGNQYIQPDLDQTSKIDEDNIDLSVPLSDPETVQLLLTKLKKVSAAVKYQTQEQAKRNQHIGVATSSKRLRKEESSENTVKIASYNLWNVNSYWEIRMQYIADMLAEMDPDIISFQEVRTLNRQTKLDLVHAYRLNKDLPIAGTLPLPETASTMMNLLFEYLPQYQWAVFAPMASFWDGTAEGVAILSKNPIIEVETRDISVFGQYSDKNSRGVLKARITLPDDEEERLIDIFNTHLTYDDKQQCPMIVKLLEFLEEGNINHPNVTQLLMGDLNTYLSSEWPTDFLENPFASFSTNEMNPCSGSFKSWVQSNEDRNDANFFVDIWEEAFPRKLDGTLEDPSRELDAMGHTFPVFKDSALINCRPDRIFRRKSHRESLASVSTFGDQVWYSANDFSKSNPHYLSDHLGVFVELLHQR